MDRHSVKIQIFVLPLFLGLNETYRGIESGERCGGGEGVVEATKEDIRFQSLLRPLFFFSCSANASL